MARCEDFPACGHERGCCPDFDPDTGAQLNMKCPCGATVPVNSRSSICEGCLSGFYGDSDDWGPEVWDAYNERFHPEPEDDDDY